MKKLGIVQVGMSLTAEKLHSDKCNIPVVINLVCPTCKVDLDKMDNGQIFCSECLKLYKQTCL